MMCKNNYCCNCRGYNYCPPVLPPPIPKPPCYVHVINEPAQPQPFLSGYIEAVANTQVIPTDLDILFQTDPDFLDIAGNAVTLDPDGMVFTINKSGLYHVEWSLNLLSATEPVLIGILENGLPASAISNSETSGNVSSGALINVAESDVPFTLSLHNFGGEILISDNAGVEGTAASIRILRFADGASV